MTVRIANYRALVALMLQPVPAAVITNSDSIAPAIIAHPAVSSQWQYGQVGANSQRTDVLLLERAH